MNRDIRSALIGGLAATFVVAASLAPRLLDQPAEVAVRNTAADQTLDTAAQTALPVGPEPTTSTTAAAPSSTTTTTADLPTRVGGLEHRVTRIEATTTTAAAPKPEVTFYYEGTLALGPEAAAEPYDGTWKVVFRTTKTEPNLRVRFMAKTKTGPAEFTAAFSDARPMYTHSAVARIDAALFDLPANAPQQGPAPLVFETIVAVEWDGGSQTF